MRIRTVRPHIVSTGFLAALLLSGSPALAQTPVRVNIAGTAFSPEGRGDQVVVEDAAGGRRFRGPAGARLILRAVLQMPSAASADPKVQRLAISFRTSPGGPSLRSVELRNGNNVEFRIETHLTGNYVGSEVITPAEGANVWAFQPRAVSSQSVLRLEVQFPVGFDSPINPGEFFLSAVATDFPRKVLTRPDSISNAEITSAAGLSRPGATSTVLSRPAVLASTSTATNGVIYVRNTNNDLLWYGHSGRGDGSFRWAAPAGKTVGTGWGFKHVFHGGDGVIYAITSTGDLMWYRHDGRGDGSFRWAAPEGKKVGTGWNFAQVFSGGSGVIYAITAGGDLLWFRHDGRGDGSATWAASEGKRVGTGWAFTQVFSGGDGVIYALTSNYDLLWYRHDGRDDGSVRWAAPEGKKVGTGWTFKHLFAAGDGIIYAITATDDLLWYRHDGFGDGSVRWAAPEGKKVGIGWTFKDVFSGAGTGS